MKCITENDCVSYCDKFGSRLICTKMGACACTLSKRDMIAFLTTSFLLFTLLKLHFEKRSRRTRSDFGVSEWRKNEGT